MTKIKGLKQTGFLAFLFLVGIFFLGCASNDRISLFDKDADDWIMEGNAQWEFVDNELVGTSNSGSGFMMTRNTYKDFILELEFYPDSTINSGVFVRCKEKELSHTDCYEINIWDEHPDQTSRTGSVVSRSVPLSHVETLDKWNTYKIKCEGKRIQAWVNGVLTADIENDDLVEGFIALQAAETGKVKFRSVALTASSEKN